MGGLREVVIVQEDLSLLEIDLPIGLYEVPIRYLIDLIDASEGKIIALCRRIEKGGKELTEVFIIDADSGAFESRLLKNPNLPKKEPGELPVVGKKYGNWTLHVSQDLRKLYFGYGMARGDGEMGSVLGKFDVSSLEEESSTGSDRCIEWMTGYDQYRGVLYSSRSYADGGATASLIDMDTIEYVMDLQEIVQQEMTSRLMVTPFGRGFLLGTNSRVIQVSVQGRILAEYPLPSDWIGREYVILEYRE